MTALTDAERRREVLSFFLRHPHTTDSVEGVARWRLLDEIVYRQVQDTERILGELVELGFLEETARPGTPRLFRLRPDSTEQAAAYMKEPSGS
jgi:hypothetical protein